MKRLFTLALAAVAASAGLAQPPAPAAPAASGGLSHGLFSEVRLHRPAGDVRQFVLLVTDDVAPTRHEDRLLHVLLDEGAMVAAVPLAPFLPRLAAQDGKCTYGPGAFENLSRDLQAYAHLPGYLLPLLVGADRTAPYAYAVLAQSPAGSFDGGLVVGFSPRLALKTPPCEINGLHLRAAAPAAAGASAVDIVPAAAGALATPVAVLASDDGFVAAYRRLATPQVALGAPPRLLADLPVVEVPVATPGRRFVVLLSGDGGWAGIDKALGSAFAAQGVPVAGFDSLRYFWSARTPEGLAADLDRVIRFYAARWGRSEVVLVGYSQGADVLPFALNRLPAATRASVKLTALLGLGQKASFEFHVTNWIGPGGDLPIAPEASKLAAADTLCLYGVQEKDSLCPELAPAHAQAVPLGGGHHFGGDYAGLAARILEAAGR